MALFQENVVIIDRGSSKIRALLVRSGMGTFDILKKETLPALPTPSLGDDEGEDDDAASNYNLLRFVQTLFPDESVFYLSVLPSELFVRNVDLPTGNVKLANEILAGDLEPLLPVSLEDAEIVAGCWQNSQEQCRMTAFAVEKTQIEELADPIVKTGKSVGYMAPLPHVLASAIQLFPSQDVIDRVVGQLDMGLYSSTFNLLLDGKLAFSRSLPIGGADFTDVIAGKLGISVEDAEQFKINSGVDISRKDIDELPATLPGRSGLTSLNLKKMKQGLIHVVKELAQEIERSILASPLREPDHLYLSGGGSLLGGISDVLEEETNLRFRRYPLLLADEPVDEWIVCLGMMQAAGAKKDARLDFLQTATGARLRRGEIRWKPFMLPGIVSASALLILLFSFIIGIVSEQNQLARLQGQMQQIAQGIPGISRNQDPVKSARNICQNRLRVMRAVLGGYRTLDILKEISDHTADSSQASLKLKSIKYDESAVELDLEVDSVNQLVPIQEKYQNSKMVSAVEVIRRDINPKQKVRLGLKLVLKPVANNLEVNCR